MSGWHVERSTSIPDAELSILTESGFVVALLGFTGPDEAQVAQLIAAAPEMLDEIARLRTQNAALLKVVKGAQRIINHAPPGGVPRDEIDAWHKDARAAIAAAAKEE